MMKNSLVLLSATALLAACGSPATEPAPSSDTDTTRTAEVAGVIAPPNAKLRLVPADPATAFPDASLELVGTAQGADGKTHFKYNVAGFELKAQTPDAASRNCANSPDGQHIHFIPNNAPYLAKYEAEFDEAVAPGRNIVLAFLSRSYHESLKNNKAVVVSEVRGAGDGGIVGGDIANDPFLFYSRPKGSYKKSDGERMLLDFYLLNTELSATGNRVRATIDGETWIITRWDAYFIDGLELGKHTVRLELIDAAGNPVPGPFNDSGEREFDLLAS